MATESHWTSYPCCSMMMNLSSALHFCPLFAHPPLSFPQLGLLALMVSFRSMGHTVELCSFCTLSKKSPCSPCGHFLLIWYIYLKGWERGLGFSGRWRSCLVVNLEVLMRDSCYWHNVRDMDWMLQHLRIWRQQVDDPWRGQVLLFEFLVLLLLLLKNLVQSTKTRHVRVILCQTLAAHPSNPKVEIA